MSGLNGTVPHNLEAEQAVLGAVLLAGTLPTAVREAGLDAEHFYRPSHVAIYSAMQALHDRGAAITDVTLLAELDRARLADGPMRSTVAAVNGVVAELSSIGDHACIVRGLAHHRGVRDIARRVYDDPGDPNALQALKDAAVPTTGAVDPDAVFNGTPMDPTAESAEPMPVVPGFPFAHPGTSAIVVGPTGGGRSSLAQACLFDAAKAGQRAAYLGSEVTESEFNARARDLASRRNETVDDDLRKQLANVRYLPLASTLAYAWASPDAWRREMAARFDIVVIDPTSAVASALDLDFDKSNADYVAFHHRLVQPLAAVGRLVVLLDNVGHGAEAQRRAKGASAKTDVADLAFACKLKTSPAGLLITATKVRSISATFRRGDTWVFDRDTQRISRHVDDDQGDQGAWRPTVLMERVSRALEETPGLTQRQIREAGLVKGNKDHKITALDVLVREGFVVERPGDRYVEHYSVAPFRHTEDSGPTGPKAAPHRPQGPPATSGPTGPSCKGQGPGATADADHLVDRAEHLELQYREAA